MVIETAYLPIKEGLSDQFEQAFTRASQLIANAPGYIGHQLHRSIENPQAYLLIVQWGTLEDHTEGFRKSPQYQEWRRLLQDFYAPTPHVEHFLPR